MKGIKMTQAQIEAILRMLESRDFEKFYKQTFNDYIEGGLGSPTRKQILAWLTAQLGGK